MRALCSSLLFFLLPSLASANALGERVFVRSGEACEVTLLTAPALTSWVGAFLDQVHESARRAVKGEAAEPVQPGSWEPVTEVPAGEPMATPLSPEPDPGQRVAALIVRKPFSGGPGAGDLRVLRLRARFADGLVARLNGVEIARRNLAEDTPPAGFATRPKGPEWETFYVRLAPGVLRPGENHLEIEVRPIHYRMAPALDFELSAGSAPRIVRGPIVQRVTTDSAAVVFETDAPTAAEVHYGKTPEALSRRASARKARPSRRHEVPLLDLPKGAVHYKIVTPFSETPVYRFHTAPAEGQPVRFVVYGDVRNGHDTHATLVKAILAEAPDFVITTGDQVMRGSDEGDWETFFRVTAELLPRIPYYPAVGNHDLGRSGDEQRLFEDVFLLWPGPDGRPEPAAWYSFDVAGLHFVMLDSNHYHEPAQLEWLERELAAAAANKPRAIFAVTHHGPYARGPHGGHPLAATLYVPLLAKYGVKVLFSGHDHIYERGEKDGLTYVVSGGGGAPLYPIRCGERGRPRCPPGDPAALAVSENHYVLVEVFRDYLRLCPRRPDGTALEACTTL